MKTRITLPIWLFLAAVPAFAQVVADPSRLERDLEKVRRELDTERELLKADAARKQSWESASRQRLTDMREQSRRAARESDSLRALIRQWEDEASLAVDQRTLAERSLVGLLEVIANEVDASRAMLRDELPSIAEDRGRQLSDISRGLRSGIITPADGLARALDVLSGLADVAGRSEAVPGVYTRGDNREIPGMYLRVGGLLEAFVSDDDQTAAIRQRTAEGTWVWRETLGKPQVAGIRSGIEVLKAQTTPGFVVLPMGVAAGGTP